MTRSANAEAQWRWRERQAGRLPPPLPCAACGKRHHGAHGALCTRCWASLTPEGRADRAARVARSRARKLLATTTTEAING